MDYRIGLDIGIASIGYAVMETDHNGEPIAIEALGVRVFEKAEDGKGRTLTSIRRGARCARRRIRRMEHRKERTEKLLENTFGAGVLEKIDESRADVYYLRYKGIDEQLLPEEIGKILLYFVKHRGFLSSRKSERKTMDESGMKMLGATQKNKEYFGEKGYRTIGEMIYKDERFSHEENGVKIYTTRNKENSYENTFLRELLKEEILVILNKQKEFGIVDDAFIEKYVEGIFFRSRSFDEGPGEGSPYRREGFAIGKCEFEKEEDRAPKATYTFEYCRALERLNSLRIKSYSGTREPTEEQRQVIIEKIKKQEEIKFSALRKILDMTEEERFNLLNYSAGKGLNDTEKKAFVSMRQSYAIRKCLTEENAKDEELLDGIGVVLSTLKTDDKRRKKFGDLGRLSSEEIEALLELDYSGFGNTSIKFLKKIRPYLEEGQKYSEACQSAGYDHTNRAENEKLVLLNTKEIYDTVNEINVPVVRRAVSQTLKVLNAIIRKYGSPLAVNIELARELAKTFDERREMTKNNEKRNKENETIKEELQKEFHLTVPTGQDIVKWRLYEEQGGKCAYSQQEFDANRLFEDNYCQIDHVIPYSKSFDDSYTNKVLVFTKENQDKKDRLPYEYFGQDEERWKRFEDFVNAQYAAKRNWTKVGKLLKKKFTEEDATDWKERNLNDTKYIARFMFNLIRENLQFAETSERKKKKVIATSGTITAYLRKFWGLTKDRTAGDKHHALDAAVIACVTDGIIQKVTQFHKGKESCRRIGDNYVNADGEVLSSEQYDEEFGKTLRQPYERFRDELTYRLAEDPKYYEKIFFMQQGYSDRKLDELKPVFVSRMVNKKVRGRLHKDGVSSVKIYEEHREIVTRTDLTKLKLDKEGKIDGYYKPEDDRLLYEKLLKMLQDANGDAKEAFKDKVYKPKADGTDGPEVKKVKIKESCTDGMPLKKGLAANGSMIRIDLFQKNGKNYVVPIYVKDAYAGVLPDQYCCAHKAQKDWVRIDETFTFAFSLYPNDLVYIRHKQNGKEEINGMFYYRGFDISGNQTSFISHDNSSEIRLGIQGVNYIEKYQVDVLGNVSKVEGESRKDFSDFRKKN